MADMIYATIVIGFATWGFVDVVYRVGKPLVPWFIRCGDNIARRLSPCAKCEGFGTPIDVPGAICDCAAGRAAQRRYHKWLTNANGWSLLNR